MPLTATMPSKAEAQKIFQHYQKDPIGFQVDCLDVKPEHVWDKMVEVAESVRDKPKTAVGAGHGVSKSYEAARLALWFLCCHYPSTVITTAPTNNQVEEILWREIRNSYAQRKIPIDVEPTKTRLDFGEKWFALGFATKPDTVTSEATRFQGFHNEHILVIFDEAAGIDPRIWKAAQHLLTSGHTRWLAIGNLTSDMGDFPDCFDVDSDWNQIHISVLDTPNYKEGRELIPGVSGRPYEQEIAEKYGRDHNEYKIRILGQKPEYTEGTFYGSRIAQLYRDGHIGDVPYEETAKVYTFGDYGDIHTAIIFAQFIQDRIHLIDFYYDNEGAGVPAYAKMFQTKPYIYGGHWSGPDLDPASGSNRKSMATGKMILDHFAELKVHMQIIHKHLVNDGIEAGRGIFSKLRIDRMRCTEFINLIKRYRLRKNEALSTEGKTVYFNEPVKDQSVHVADAYRHLAMGYRYQVVINNQRIGYMHPIPATGQRARQNYDRLRTGLVRRR